MKCAHCGAVGEKLHYEPVRIRGSVIYLLYCDDNKACWNRWELKELKKKGVKDAKETPQDVRTIYGNSERMHLPTHAKKGRD